jgi:transposase
MRGGNPGKLTTVYKYNASEHQQFVHNWFNGFNGYLHADGDNVFNLVGNDNASMVNCNAHARRKFEPLAQASTGKGIAKESLVLNGLCKYRSRNSNLI